MSDFDILPLAFCRGQNALPRDAVLGEELFEKSSSAFFLGEFLKKGPKNPASSHPFGRAGRVVAPDGCRQYIEVRHKKTKTLTHEKML